jgi:hypothetical protein
VGASVSLDTGKKAIIFTLPGLVFLPVLSLYLLSYPGSLYVFVCTSAYFIINDTYRIDDTQPLCGPPFAYMRPTSV